MCFDNINGAYLAFQNDISEFESEKISEDRFQHGGVEERVSFPPSTLSHLALLGFVWVYDYVLHTTNGQVPWVRGGRNEIAQQRILDHHCVDAAKSRRQTYRRTQ